MYTESLRQKVIWLVREKGPCSASDVCETLRQTRSISLNAVQTVLNRLVEQDLLIRTGTRRLYVYEAKPSDEAIKETATRAAIDLLSQSGDVGFSHFLDAIDQIQPDAIEKLEDLLAQRRAKENES